MNHKQIILNGSKCYEKYKTSQGGSGVIRKGGGAYTTWSEKPSTLGNVRMEPAM